MNKKKFGVFCLVMPTKKLRKYGRLMIIAKDNMFKIDISILNIILSLAIIYITGDD